MATHPLTDPRGIATSAARAFAQPAVARFMKRHHDFDDLDDQRETKLTQEEQDAEDEMARKRAMKHLVSSWQERLQLLSVITTFFATTEASMLVNTKPGSSDEWKNAILKASNASFLGALILHVCASVLAFLGAFILISFKLREAKREEMIVEGLAQADSPLGDSATDDVEKGIQRTSTTDDTQSTMRQKNLANLPVFSANPHIEQVSPFAANVSSERLLSRTHGVCVLLAAMGFVLAIVGIMCYSWGLQPTSVSIFATACLGGAFLSLFALRV